VLDLADDDGEDGRDETRLEATDEAFDAVRLDASDCAQDALHLDPVRLEASDGALVDGTESRGPHHSGRRPLALLDLEDERTPNGGSSLLMLCGFAKDGRAGAILDFV